MAVRHLGLLLAIAVAAGGCAGDDSDGGLSAADRRKATDTVRTYVELRLTEAQQGNLRPQSAARLRAITHPDVFREIQAEATTTVAQEPPNVCRAALLEVHAEDPAEIWVDALLECTPDGGAALGVLVERRGDGWRVMPSRDMRFDARNVCRATSCR